MPERDIEDLVVRPAQVFRDKQGINLLTGHCAETIDPGKQTVSGGTLDGGQFEFPYDRLLIATGSSAALPDLAGFDLPGVMVVKSLEDGRKIKNVLKKNHVKKAIIVGMGYIALEVCESLVGLNIAVDMVKPNPTLLPWLEPSMARTVKEGLEAKGVGIYAGHSVEGIEKTTTQIIEKEIAL